MLATVDGELGYGAGEGRLYGEFTSNNTNKEVQRIYAEIKQIFDPLGILNPGVKMKNDAKELVKLVRNGK